MEEENTKETIVVSPEVNVIVDNVHMAAEQYDELMTELRVQSEEMKTLNKNVVHATMFLILLCIFQLYGLLSRARKKGGA